MSKKRITLIIIIALLSTVIVNAQTIFGKWKNPDNVTCKVNSIVEVY